MTRYLNLELPRVTLPICIGELILFYKREMEQVLQTRRNHDRIMRELRTDYGQYLYDYVQSVTNALTYNLDWTPFTFSEWILDW